MTDQAEKNPRETKGGRGKSVAAARARRKSGPEETVAIIDRLLLTPMRARLNGRNRRMPTLAAIVFQLLQKEMAGDSQAARVLLKYERLIDRDSKKRLEINFVDSDYTRTFGDAQPESGNG